MVDVYASEEEQVAAIKKWWKENGTSIILGIAIGSAALFGWRYWQGQITIKGQQASQAYSKMEQQLATNNNEQATATATQLMQEFGSTPYAAFAALKQAKIAVDAKDTESANNYLRWVIDNGSSAELVQTATMRLARLLISSDNADSAWAVFSTLDDNVASLASYHELKGDILLVQGKQEEAKNAYLQSSVLNPAGPGGNAFLEMKMDDLGR